MQQGHLDTVFSKLSEDGVFLLGTGTKFSLEYEYGIISDIAIERCSLSVNELSDIEQIVATVIGISADSSDGGNLMQEWYRLTGKVYPAMTLYPEQFLLSVAAWRAKVKAMASLNSYLYVCSQIPKRPKNDHKKPFWFDKS